MQLRRSFETTWARPHGCGGGGLLEVLKSRRCPHDAAGAVLLAIMSFDRFSATCGCSGDNEDVAAVERYVRTSQLFERLVSTRNRRVLIPIEIINHRSAK